MISLYLDLQGENGGSSSRSMVGHVVWKRISHASCSKHIYHRGYGRDIMPEPFFSEDRPLERLPATILITFHQLTDPLFQTLAIIFADRYSRAFEASRHTQDRYEDTAARDRTLRESQKTPYEKFMHFGKENRYPIIGVSWVASMAIALGLVGRSPYLSAPQKLVQARVYAQGLTLAVLLATAVFEIGDRNEGEGRWETVKVLDPNDPEHKHLIEKKVHHERYAGEDMWKGGYTSDSVACFGVVLWNLEC